MTHPPYSGSYLQNEAIQEIKMTAEAYKLDPQEEEMQMQIQKLLPMLDKDVSELPSKASNGKTFSGILYAANFNGNADGLVFGSSKFPDNSYMYSSYIVYCGYCSELDVYYIETINHSRYIIASVRFNKHLSVSTESVEAAIKEKAHHIEINSNHFDQFRWSAQTNKTTAEATGRYVAVLSHRGGEAVAYVHESIAQDLVKRLESQFHSLSNIYSSEATEICWNISDKQEMPPQKIQSEPLIDITVGTRVWAKILDENAQPEWLTLIRMYLFFK